MRHLLTLVLILALAFPVKVGAIAFEASEDGAYPGGAVLGSLGETTTGNDKAGFVDTAKNRVASMQTSNELMNTSEEFVKLFSGQPLTDEQKQQLGKDMQATAAQYGLTVDTFILYLSENLKPGMYNPGDPAAGAPGSTVAVNMVGNDGKQIFSGVEALERIFHEYGHPAYGPGKEADAQALGSFAAWYGKNVLSMLYGIDPTKQTYSVADYKQDYADDSLVKNTAQAWLMEKSSKTEFDGGSNYLNHPYLYTPEQIAEFERSHDLTNKGAGYFWQGLDLDTDGKNWSYEERVGYKAAETMSYLPYVAQAAFIIRGSQKLTPAEQWQALQSPQRGVTLEPYVPNEPIGTR